MAKTISEQIFISYYHDKLNSESNTEPHPQ
jgi:hypothetical protein